MAHSGKIRVGIVFGGQSAEHEISILAARNVLAALDRSRFEPILIGIDKTGRWLAQDVQKLLTSAQDPRLARIESGVPVHRASHFSAPPSSSCTPTSHFDVVFPVLH